MFHIRPIRRVAILSFMVLAWRSVRTSILEATRSVELSPTRRFFVNLLLWVFVDAVPLALDSPTLLVCGNPEVYFDVLKRLLHLFMRLRKQNYIVVVAYILAAAAQIAGTHMETPFRAALPHLSSEDIEVFHSVLRASTRYQDTQAQVARKALMITARHTSPIKVLKRWSELRQAVEQDEVKC